MLVCDSSSSVMDFIHILYFITDGIKFIYDIQRKYHIRVHQLGAKIEIIYMESQQVLV